MSVILLAGQYDFPVRAEENAEMPGSEAGGVMQKRGTVQAEVMQARRER